MAMSWIINLYKIRCKRCGQEFYDLYEFLQHSCQEAEASEA